jgi:small-conductance mechanosensitive channel
MHEAMDQASECMRRDTRRAVLLAWVIAGLLLGFAGGSVAGEAGVGRRDARPVESAASAGAADEPSRHPTTPTVAAGPADAGAAASGTKPAARAPFPTAALNASLGAPPESVRRETPREMIAGFLGASRSRDFDRAAHYLHNAPGTPRALAAVVAERLFDVLDSKVWFDLDSISDDPEAGGDKPGGAMREVQVASIPVEGGSQGVRVARVTDGTGHAVWVFSRATVQAIDGLHRRYGPPAFLQSLPGWMRGGWLLGLEVWQWLGLVLLGLSSWAAGAAAERVGLRLLGAAAARSRLAKGAELVEALRGPVRLFGALVVLAAALPWLRFSISTSHTLTRLAYVGIVVAVTRALIRLVSHGAGLVQAHAFRDLEADAEARAMATRATTVQRIATVLLVVIGTAVALMQFPLVRSVGLSLLGSAGIAGAILGFAAQKVFSNILSGIMISLTQPIRIGDTVVVEKEWGQVEEIGATHVVVKTWDLRRLVLPISYFLEKPFENWTRASPELLGTVHVRTDYRVRPEQVREELDRILEGEPLWNGKSKGLIVEELGEATATLRVLVSADDASKLWDLRCKVRERLLAFLQAEPARLPMRRVETRTVPA